MSVTDLPCLLIALMCVLATSSFQEMERMSCESYCSLCNLRPRCAQAHIGEYILCSRASTVVVETALTPQHGTMTGNVFSCNGPDVMHAGPFARMLCYCARQLADLPSPADTPLWKVRCLQQWKTVCYPCNFPFALPLCRPYGRRLYHAETGVDDVPMLHTLTSWARPGWNLMTTSGFL